jgi:hypothetical protein
MPTGICVMRTTTGEPYAVRTDFGNNVENDLDIPYYVGQSYQPPWETLQTCSGTGPEPSATM